MGLTTEMLNFTSYSVCFLCKTVIDFVKNYSEYIICSVLNTNQIKSNSVALYVYFENYNLVFQYDIPSIR